MSLTKEEAVSIIKDNTIHTLEEENRLLQMKLDALDGLIPWNEIANCNEQIKENLRLRRENIILKEALHLYIDWADECGIAWDNFPDMKEKWWKAVEEKGLGWIDGLMFMVIEEVKERSLREVHNDERPVQTDDKDKACH